MSTTNYDCDQCGKPCTAKTVIYNRYKTHFCGKGCKAAHQRGAKDRAKDERIRELEALAEQRQRVADRVAEIAKDYAKERDHWKNEWTKQLVEASTERDDKEALEQRNRKLRALAWVGWTSCLLCLLWALWGQHRVFWLEEDGRNLSRELQRREQQLQASINYSMGLEDRLRGYGPDTIPSTDSLVVCWQGEGRTPHIAYVDSLGEWRDAENGEKLNVTKWSRP